MNPRRSTSALIGLLILLLPCASPAAYPEDTETHLIDVGAYHLFFRVLRGGDPVILLEAGGGMDSNCYADLAPRLHEETGATVVAYDRAGFGGSDLPDLPCDMREESQSLWRALGILGLDHDVVLVGWSYGGWMSRLHANDHPDQVAGVVFLDPFNCRLIEELGVEYCDAHPMMGALPFADADPATLTREQKALLRMVGEGLGPKLAIMKPTRVPAGIPVRLLSSRRPFLLNDREQQVWWQSHREIVDGIAGARLVEATGSSHGVHFDQPELVLQQIREVVEEVRDR